MKNTNNSSTIAIIALIISVVVLVLGLTGKFAGTSFLEGSGLSKSDIQQIVAGEMKNRPAPSAPTPTPQPTRQPAPTVTKADLSEIKKFYEQSYIKGNKDAPVTVIEFSDFECPFCKRHSNAGTLNSVLQKYGDDVNVVFTHFPLGFHTLAQKAQEASECVGEQGGAEAFYAFKKGVYADSGKPTRDVLEKVAGGIDGIDVEKFKTCINDGKYAQKVTDAMNLGRKLGVTGTPGNIVMNNKTGEFIKVSGAVPANAFDGPISSMLEK